MLPGCVPRTSFAVVYDCGLGCGFVTVPLRGQVVSLAVTGHVVCSKDGTCKPRLTGRHNAGNVRVTRQLLGGLDGCTCARLRWMVL